MAPNAMSGMGDSVQVDDGSCLTTSLNSPLDRESAAAVTTLLKAVADPARLQILALIRASDTGELCVCDFTDALGLSQSTVSHHLKVLTSAGVLSRRQQGTWAHFQVVPERLADIANFFQQ